MGACFSFPCYGLGLGLATHLRFLGFRACYEQASPFSGSGYARSDQVRTDQNRSVQKPTCEAFVELWRNNYCIGFRASYRIQGLTKGMLCHLCCSIQGGSDQIVTKNIFASATSTRPAACARRRVFPFLPISHTYGLHQTRSFWFLRGHVNSACEDSMSTAATVALCCLIGCLKYCFPAPFQFFSTQEAGIPGSAAVQVGWTHCVRTDQIRSYPIKSRTALDCKEV